MLSVCRQKPLRTRPPQLDGRPLGTASAGASGGEAGARGHFPAPAPTPWSQARGPDSGGLCDSARGSKTVPTFKSLFPGPPKAGGGTAGLGVAPPDVLCAPPAGGPQWGGRRPSAPRGGDRASLSVSGRGAGRVSAPRFSPQPRTPDAGRGQPGRPLPAALAGHRPRAPRRKAGHLEYEVALCARALFCAP